MRGGSLTPRDTGPWDEAQGQYPPIVIGADDAVIASGLEVGDRLTFEIAGSGNRPASGIGPTQTQEVTFEIVGMVDRRGSNISVNFGSPNYAPKSAFDARGLSPDMVSAVVDVDEKQVRELRRSMNDMPGVFVLETRSCSTT